MAAPGKINTPRGQVDVYLYHRTDSNQSMNRPDYVFNSDSSSVEADHLDGITQAKLNEYLAENGWTLTEEVNDVDVSSVVTYNPITESFDLKPGTYVL